MVKQYSDFFGYDLRQGAQIIAGVSGLLSLIVAPILFYGAAAGEDFIAEAEVINPNVRNYGGSTAFWYAIFHVGIQEVVHLIICILLYLGAKVDGASFVRSWIRSSVIWLCFHAILIPFAAVILFAAGANGAAAAALVGLLILFPLKAYFTLVVNSYHNTIAPGHFWGSSLRVSDTYHGPRSCQTVPQVTSTQPTVVLIN